MADGVRSVHAQASDWLVRLREAPGDGKVEEAFGNWLDADPDNARAWVSVTDIFESIGELQPELEAKWRGAGAGLPGAAVPRRRRLWPRRPAARRYLPWAAGAVAAMLAILLAPAAMLHIRSDHMTAPGQIGVVRLADGSAVQLGPDSAIAVDYQPGRRGIRLLAGQAWFDVRPDAAAPFEVVAGEVRTTVLGTSFDVRRIGASTDISVRRGHVRVQDDGASPPHAHDLRAGQWIRMQANDEVSAGRDDPDLFGAWRQGSLVVRNRPIADVIEELRPWHDGRILLLAPNLGRRRIDGVYDARDPQHALAAMVEPAGGDVRRIGSWLIVIP